MQPDLHSRRRYLENLSRAELQRLAKEYPEIKGNWTSRTIIERLLDPVVGSFLHPEYSSLQVVSSANASSFCFAIASASPMPASDSAKRKRAVDASPTNKRRRVSESSCDELKLAMRPVTNDICSTAPEAFVKSQSDSQDSVTMPSQIDDSLRTVDAEKRYQTRSVSAVSDALRVEGLIARSNCVAGVTPPPRPELDACPLTPSPPSLYATVPRSPIQIYEDVTKNANRKRSRSESPSEPELPGHIRRKLSPDNVFEDGASHVSTASTNKGKAKMTDAELEAYQLEMHQATQDGQVEEGDGATSEFETCQQRVSEEYARKIEPLVNSGPNQQSEEDTAAQQLARDEELARALEYEEQQEEMGERKAEDESAVQIVEELYSRIGNQRMFGVLAKVLERQAQLQSLYWKAHATALLSALFQLGDDPDTRQQFYWILQNIKAKISSVQRDV
ncbi:hypothetical protein HWV62_44053 [Athelia sp. TMB]|nr:hypothetical protein HWV62_27200 [Athelia sp. TMB]KAF7979049.1 hypothetical protein HWV62_44053 [Athelia sp. TMB]